MTVKELIEELKDVDEEMEVDIYIRYHVPASFCDIVPTSEKEDCEKRFCIFAN